MILLHLEGQDLRQPGLLLEILVSKYNFFKTLLNRPYLKASRQSGWRQREWFNGLHTSNTTAIYIKMMDREKTKKKESYWSVSLNATLQNIWALQSVFIYRWFVKLVYYILFFASIKSGTITSLIRKAEYKRIPPSSFQTYHPHVPSSPTDQPVLELQTCWDKLTKREQAFSVWRSLWKKLDQQKTDQLAEEGKLGDCE